MFDVRSEKNRCFRILCVGLMLVPSVAAAQSVDIAAVAPEDALLLVGSSGCANTAAARGETAVGKTLADPQVSAFLDQAWAAIDLLISRAATDSGSVPAYDAGKRVLSQFVKKPTALVVLDFGFGPMGPGVSAAVVCQAGEDGATLMEDMTTLIAGLGLPPAAQTEVEGIPVHQLFVVPGGLFYTMLGDHFVLASGPQTVSILSSVLKGESASLAGSSLLRQCRARIGGTDQTRQCSFFLNVTKLRDRVEMLLPMFTGGNPEAQQWFSGFMDSSGYGKVKAYCAETHHRNGGCQTGIYVPTDGPPSGVLACYAGRPITDRELGIIPKEVSWATAMRFSPASFYDAYLGMLNQAMPGGAGEVTGMIAEQEAEIGVNIRQDILGSFGDTVVVFDEPGEGFLFTGVTVCATVKDADKLTDSLQKVVRFVQREVADGEATLRLNASSYRGHTVTTLSVSGLPIPLAPAWSFHGEWMVLGLFPQTIYGTLDRLIDGDPQKDSILANSEFRRGREAVGSFGSIVGYNDSKAAVNDLYAIALPAVQAAMAMAQGQGVDMDIADFPHRKAWTRHLFSDVYTGGADDTGLYYSSHGPLAVPIPAVGSSALALGVAAIGASIVVPSVMEARSTAKRAVCAQNLRGIGKACRIYANDHDGQFPDRLDVLVESGAMTSAQLECPDPGWEGGRYHYVSGLTEEGHDRNVVAYDREGAHEWDGVNVLFLDGHVEFMEMWAFEEALKATKSRLAETSKE